MLKILNLQKNNKVKKIKAMKKISVILLGLVMGMMLTVNAQAPYRHSIGVTLGNMEAFSYKTFFTENFAFSVDAGFKWTVSSAHLFSKADHFAYKGTIWPMTVEANPNFMYEAAAGPKGLHWFVGGGVSVGYSWSATDHNHYDAYYYDYSYYSFGKIGVNAIGGVEYKFNIPLTLQADLRPGFGLLFNKHFTINYFDWAICVGVRYTIK